MIVTVTLNTAIDHIIKVPRFELGATIRSSEAFHAMGGKGTDASYILGTLGIKNLAMGYSAGIFGAKMERMLQERNVATGFVHVGGETRINTLLICGTEGQSTFTVDTLEINDSHIEQLHAHLTDQLPEAGCVVFGGSPPVQYPLDRYREMIDLTKEYKVPAIVDASGEALRMACEARPAFIKINQDEMEQLVRKRFSTFNEIIAGILDVQSTTGASVVLTLGDRGAIAAVEDQLFKISPVRVRVVNTAGAGDAVLAGIAKALDSGTDIVDGLRLGFAAAAAVMMTPRTADCDPEQVERLLDEIQIELLKA